MHQVINLLQLGQAHDLIRRLDKATPVEVERLGGVLTVADVAAFDSDHLDDGLEDRCTQVGAGG